MQRKILALITPPIAVCRYGCASCCVAPIFVFWLASIGSVIYAFFGGPAGLDGFSWGTLALGIILWAISVAWAETVIKGVSDDLENPKCNGKTSTLCSIVSSNNSDIEPLDEVNKYL
ncbi:hypothetical protein MNBD_GAMMA23-2015 [hydrothermal vent metagenome]|uniref:Uncharacterized protein n=1 Tax=hydrothermal vent metagenome TaxID=652676 RepID=A0A3B1A0P3_9ZZZZ